MKKIILIILVGLFSGSNLFAQEESLSLITFNWRSYPVRIVNPVFVFKDDGAYVKVDSYYTFQQDYSIDDHDYNDIRELVANFSLPNEYIISDLWLWIDDGIVKARVYDKNTAETIYDDIVPDRDEIPRLTDPAILTYEGNNEYELRIYPFEYSSARRVKLSYLVPQNRFGDITFLEVPNQLLKLSSSIYESNIEIGIWKKNLPESISIYEHEDAEFSVIQHDDEYLIKSKLQLNSKSERVGIRIEESTKKKNEYRTYETANGNYYFLSIDPTELVENNPKTVVAMVDYTPSNASISKGALFNYLTNGVKKWLEDEDKFNVIFSGLEISPVSDTFISGSDNSVDSLFSLLNSNNISNITNLPQLYFKAIEFAEEHNPGKKTEILLISDSQSHSTITSTTNLINELKKSTDNISVSFSTIDFQDQNFITYEHNGLRYSGNEYLYTQLSSIFGGAYFNSRDFITSSNVLKYGFESIESDIRISDINENSFYDRFVINNKGEEYQSLYNEVGKYDESKIDSISLDVSNNDSLIQMRIPIDDSFYTQNQDTTIRRFWASNRIKEIEFSNTDSLTIDEAISLSIGNSILSLYTGFIVLEPSDTVQYCGSCIDESLLIGNEQVNEITNFGIDTLVAYPNPFNPTINIQVSVSSPWDSNTSSIEIFNVLGQKIAVLNTAQFNGLQNFTISWSSLEAGNLPTGVYMVRLKTQYSIKTLKVTFLK